MSAMSVRSAAAWALASQYSSFALQFMTSVVLARWFITPAELGLFSIAFAAVTLVAFMQDFGVTRYINGERDLTDEKLHTAFTLSVTVAWGIAILTIFAAWPIAWFYGDPRLLGITLVVASSYLFVPLAIVPQALCQRRLDFRSNTMIEVGSSVANAVVSIALAVRGHGALALAWGAFAQQVARFAISQWRAGFVLPWPLHLKGARPIVEIGGTNTVLAVCGSIISRAPELVIGRLVGNAAVGLFTRASGLAMQLRLLVAGAVSGVFYPAFRRVRDEGQPLGPPYLRVVAAYTGITWPAMAGIAVFAEPLIRILYGERWLAAAPLLMWIALSQLCYVAVPLNGDLPILLGRMRGLIHRNIAETVASIAMLAIAAPFGLFWVAVSRLAHGLFWVLLYAPYIRGMLGLSWRELLTIWGKSLVATLAAIAPAIGGYLLWGGPEQTGFIRMMLAVLCGVGCWLVALRNLRHPLHGEIVSMIDEVAKALLPRLTRSTQPLG